MSDDSQADDSELTREPTASPKLRRRRVQQLGNEIGRLAGSVAGCGLIGWACYNLVANVRFLRVAGADDVSFGLAASVVAVFCVVPFAAGIWLVAKSMR